MERRSVKKEQGDDQLQEQGLYAALSCTNPIEMDNAIVNDLNMNMLTDELTHPLSNHTSILFPTNQEFMTDATFFTMEYNPFYPTTAYDVFPRRHSMAGPSDNQSVRLVPARASMPNISNKDTVPLGKTHLDFVPPRVRSNSIATPQDISRFNKKVKLDDDYPVMSAADVEAAQKNSCAIPRCQKLRFADDQYTPKWVRYTGESKEGYCDACQKWLQLKNSKFWYHKQFFHGISSVLGKPFESPLEQREGKNEHVEGLCHQCKEYVMICTSSTKRKSNALWYRHAHKCHVYNKPKSSKPLSYKNK